jgi:Cu-Zn family superoxide dismutase
MERGVPRMHLFAAGFMLVAVAGCGSDSADKPPSPSSPTPLTARAVFYNPEGQEVGSAELTEPAGRRTSSPEFASSARVNGGPGVSMRIQVTGLTPGLHGLAIHAVGRCDLPRFTSAGPHFNPFGKKHGARNPQGPHAGDLGNISVGADGSGQLQLTDPLVTLAPEENNSLLLPIGTSLVVHADPDDETTDPDGNAGGRVACGAIVNPRASPSPSFSSRSGSPSAASSAGPSGTPSASPSP